MRHRHDFAGALDGGGVEAHDRIEADVLRRVPRRPFVEEREPCFG
jgi:hypothetical protein